MTKEQLDYMAEVNTHYMTLPEAFKAGYIEGANAQIGEAIRCFNFALKGNSDEMTLLEIRTLLESLKIKQ